MKIKYYGHACFKIVDSEGKSVVFDPYDESVGLGMLKVDANEMFISHEHFDHNYREAVNLIKSYSKIDVKVIESFHDDKRGALRGNNKIHVVKIDNKVVCHLGDLGHMLSNDALNAIGKVDVLLLPIGGVYTIDAKMAFEVMKKINAKINIPMHYKVDGLNVNIEGIDKFINVLDNNIYVCKLNKDEIIISDELKKGVYVLK